MCRAIVCFCALVVQKDLEAHAEGCILVPADADVAEPREPVVFEDPKDDEEPSWVLSLRSHEGAEPTRFALATSWPIKGVEGTSFVTLEGLLKLMKLKLKFRSIATFRKSEVFG